MRNLWLALKIAPTIVRHPSLLKRVLRVLDHDEIYDSDYFAFVEKTTSESADAIVQSIMSEIRPCSVVDVGCGTGVMLERFGKLGISAKGLDYSRIALRYCRERGLDVEPFNIETDELPDRFTGADVAISVEVGHQLNPASSQRYIDLLSRIGESIVFSSNTPGSGDRNPRNARDHEFWIDGFAARGFDHDKRLSSAWRQEWRTKGVSPWFASNVMIFRRRAG